MESSAYCHFEQQPIELSARQKEKARRTSLLYAYDRQFPQSSRSLIVGVDEAGRGPLAGPVVAAAVVLHYQNEISGIDDSKKLSDKRRRELYPLIIQSAVAYHIVAVDNQMIDQINILEATRLAMTQAINGLKVPISLVLTDAVILPDITKVRVQNIIRGDAKSAAIAAASVLAKVYRDNIMEDYHLQYPDYNFHRHKGYPTAEHLAKLNEHGVCKIHRRKFRPVARCLGISL